MILKYQKPEQKGTKEISSATMFESTHVVSGIDKYEFGYFKEEGASLRDAEMYVTYHLAGDAEDKWHSVTLRASCSAFIMNDDGKTIERIR